MMTMKDKVKQLNHDAHTMQPYLMSYHFIKKIIAKLCKIKDYNNKIQKQLM